ncbi:noncompact myelin-associated protein [Anoplopoma fimbria]|uniref:noncompact myelin-associated protein n=1 Tax=Anoplopoma fimbria TaxID=229290 RepID=UPI0023EBB843|nr:noncompact myelin-associated protein [Anoplopoma fimbria]
MKSSYTFKQRHSPDWVHRRGHHLAPGGYSSLPPLDYAPISQLREGALRCSGSHLEKAWAEIKEETVRLLLKMQASTVSTVTNTTVTTNTTTKSKEQILIQSSGAMIAVIVIGIIIILAILLIILKTYNRRTHVSRVLGARSGSKPRPKMSQSTINSNIPLSAVGVNSVSGSIFSSNPGSENGSQLPREELNSAEGNHIEQLSTISESTAITINDPLSIGNT